MDFTLDNIKKHCNIDSWFKDDDMYLLSLMGVAKDVVERDIDNTFSNIEAEYGKLPDAIVYACMLFVGHCYANRESVTVAQLHKVPLSYQYLIDLYKQYDKSNIQTTNISCPCC